MLKESDVASMFGGASKPNTAYVLAKGYPSDSQNTVAGVYLNGSLVFSYSRDWHISVWDNTKGTWASGINFYGATYVVGSHARFDVYASETRVAQQAAFVNSINALDERYTIIVGGSHAPEFYNEAMKAAIISIGGSSSNLSWSSRSSYFCVGRKGLPEGGAISEGVDNLAPEGNNGITWARGDFFLGKAMSVSGCFEANISEVGITRGLVAYYPLNKDARDYSSNGSHGTVAGAALVGGGFDGRGAYRFDGADDYIRMSTAAMNPTSHTISGWFLKRSHTSNSYPIFLSYVLPYIACDGASSPFRVSYTASSQVDAAGGIIPVLNTWYHVCAVFDTNGVSLYVNGAFQTRNPALCTNTGGTFDIGRHFDGNAYAVNGDICNVKIFNRALTAEEIAIEYKRTGPTKMTQYNGTLYIQGQVKEGG